MSNAIPITDDDCVGYCYAPPNLRSIHECGGLNANKHGASSAARSKRAISDFQELGKGLAWDRKSQAYFLVVIFFTFRSIFSSIDHSITRVLIYARTTVRYRN